MSTAVKLSLSVTRYEQFFATSNSDFARRDFCDEQRVFFVTIREQFSQRVILHGISSRQTTDKSNRKL